MKEIRFPAGHTKINDQGEGRRRRMGLFKSNQPSKPKMNASGWCIAAIPLESSDKTWRRKGAVRKENPRAFFLPRPKPGPLLQSREKESLRARIACKQTLGFSYTQALMEEGAGGDTYIGCESGVSIFSLLLCRRWRSGNHFPTDLCMQQNT